QFVASAAAQWAAPPCPAAVITVRLPLEVGEVSGLTIAFVLRGGGEPGAHEFDMLRALGELQIRPDLVVGTSVGAINGAFVAANPDAAADRLGELWAVAPLQVTFSGTLLGRATRLARSGTHLHEIEPLLKMLDDELPAKDFSDLTLPFNCVAASIEHATAHWFTSGPLAS